MNRRFRRRLRYRQHPQRHRGAVQGAIVPSSSDPDWQRFDADLTELEDAVQALRARFDQVRSLQLQQRQIQQQLEVPNLSPAEMEDLQQRLQALETLLDSQLFDWRSLQEPFWQAVRFGGLGIIIGWVLHAVVNR